MAQTALAVAPYVHPALNIYVTGGDSRAANSMGLGRSGTLGTSNATVTWTRSLSNGGLGHIPDVMDNAMLAGPYGHYGVGATTSLNMFDRISSADARSYRNTPTDPNANPAQAVTSSAGGADADWNIGSSSEYSPTGDPAGAFIYHDPINDTGGNSPYNAISYSLDKISKIVDALIAAGKDPIFVTDSQPVSGSIAIWNEFHTVSGSTVTATNTTAPFKDGSNWGPIGVASVWGDDPTASGYNVSTARKGWRPFTRVASSPAQFQYSVNETTGVYTFNASTPPGNVTLTYSYGDGKTTGNYRDTQRAYINSAASNFVGPDSTNYGIPGLLYNRPQVVVIPQFSSLTKSGSGASAVAYEGCFDSLDLHHSFYGAHRMGVVAAKPTIQGVYPSAVSKAQEPALNNWEIGTFTGGSNSLSGSTIPSALLAQINALGVGNRNAKLRFWYVAGYQMTTMDIVDGGASTGSFSGTYVNNSNTSTVSGTLNYSTGVITMTHSPTIPVNNHLSIEADPTNYLLNPLFDLSSGTVALPSGWTGQAIPKGFTSSVSTAVGTAITNGTLSVTASTTTDSKGRTQWGFTVDGYCPSGYSIGIIQSITQSRLQVGDKLRAGGMFEVGPGASGAITGLYGFGPQVFYQNSVAGGIAFPDQGPTSSTEAQSILTSRVTGTSSLPIDDRSLSLEPNGRGGFTRYMLTDLLNTGFIPSQQLSNFQYKMQCDCNAGPQSFKVMLSGAMLRTYTL